MFIILSPMDIDHNVLCEQKMSINKKLYVVCFLILLLGIDCPSFKHAQFHIL